MPTSSPPPHRRDFHVAIICALQLEADAVEEVFDRFWDEDVDRYGKASGDQNAYRTGIVGNHNVVLAYMAGIGKGHAASVAASFRSSFPGIRLALVVGVCGGVPGAIHPGIFLGDVIISNEIVIYDLGRRLPGGFYRKPTVTDSGMTIEVRAFLQKLKSQKGREHLLSRTSYHLNTLQTKTDTYLCPARNLDRLFEPTYHHKHRRASKCKKCKKKEHCLKAHESTCEPLQCDRNQLILRSRPSTGGTNIHFGRIASGDTVMKSGLERDRIAAEENIIAFEMEGAGISNSLPCIVVKSVCDYADSHKDKSWQTYTAGRAAACMKSLLEQWAIVDQHEGTDERLWHSSQKCSPPPSEPPTIPSDESYHRESLCGSQGKHNNSAGDLLRGILLASKLLNKKKLTIAVVPKIESSFSNALTCFKKYRKYLPRDSDLKRKLKTQLAVFSGNVELLSGDDLGSIDHAEWNITLEVAQAIRVKLDDIIEITCHLPATTKAKIQPRSASDTLKVRLRHHFSNNLILIDPYIRTQSKT
jgi:nucleoside phosphorylase